MTEVGVALLSFGLSGKAFHAPFIDAHAGLTLYGCWERSTKRIQQQYPSAKSFATLEELLDEPQVDLVVVNTPTYLHYEHTKRCLQAGKSVIVEKAFTATLAEAVELKSLAEEKKKQAFI